MRNLLYFVGAGLTKSLARPNRPVPAMFDFVSTAAEYLYDDVVLTTLAELENAEPYPYLWESQGAKELARQLVGRDRNTTPELRYAFSRALKERPAESIEDLLDRSGGASSNMSSQSAEVRFRYAIRRLFSLIGWDVDWSPLTSFISTQFKLPNAFHTFVSFNYDLVLDRAIQRCLPMGTDPANIYGFEILLFVTGDPPRNIDGAVETPPAIALSKSEPRQSIASVLKPHGSLNWLVPTSTAEVLADDPLGQGKSIILPLAIDGSLRYFSSTETFQRVQPPGRLPVEVEPLILTPRSAKRPDRHFLFSIREQEEEAIRSADEVYILGWSIPRTDADQECLIRSNVSKRTSFFEQVTVVNFLAGVDYFSRVADIFGANRSALRTFNSGFKEFAASR